MQAVGLIFHIKQKLFQLDQKYRSYQELSEKSRKAEKIQNFVKKMQIFKIKA